MNEAQDERPSRIAGWKDEVFGTMKEVGILRPLLPAFLFTHKRAE